MKTVFYCRLSASKRKKSGELDIDNQIEILRERWGDQEVHSEQVSGAKHRAVLRGLIETLPRGSIIYAVQLDRLGRLSIFDTLELLKSARDRKIKIITIHDGDLTTEISVEREMMNALKAFSAITERESTSRRMQDHIAARKILGLGWGAEQAKLNGKFKPGHKPVNPIFIQAKPRLKELRAQGLTYDQIIEIASKEFGYPFSKTHVFRMINEEEKSA